MTSCCPIPGCTIHRRPGHLMCPDHWRMVPFAQQRAVNRAWRMIFNKKATLQEASDAIKAHRLEKQAAIRMVTALVTPVVPTAEALP